MRTLPPEQAGEETGGIPGAIIRAAAPARVAAILGLFLVGGAAVFLMASPFLRSIFGLATLLGVSSYQFIQWIAPLVSEAPEGISAFYWARDPERAPMALMNLVSSNINQWTLLAAMLPIVLVGKFRPCRRHSARCRTEPGRAAHALSVAAGSDFTD